MTQKYRCGDTAQKIQNDSKFFCRKFANAILRINEFARGEPDACSSYREDDFARRRTRRKCSNDPAVERRRDSFNAPRSIGETPCRDSEAARRADVYCGTCFDCITLRSAA